MEIMYRRTKFDFSLISVLLASRLENVFCFMTLGHLIEKIKLCHTAVQWFSSFHNLISKYLPLFVLSVSRLNQVT